MPVDNLRQWEDTDTF